MLKIKEFIRYLKHFKAILNYFNQKFSICLLRKQEKIKENKRKTEIVNCILKKFQKSVDKVLCLY